MSSIHILDDDSLLNMFHLYRSIIFDKDEADNPQIFAGEWISERWWYKLAHVCQRWRSLILGSASHLDLCLLCTHRTPVAYMLANSPPLPIVIDHIKKYYKKPTNPKDEAGILIALQQQDRVRRIRLGVRTLDLQKLLSSMDKEFPMLEYLCIMPMIKKWNARWILPTRFQAPRLRHLILTDFALPTRSLLTTGAARGLVTLTFESVDSSADFILNDLLERLSLMHHLQSFAIHFNASPDSDVDGQLLTMTHVNLPNLHSFAFQGHCAYLEALLPHITTPLLEKLYIGLTNELTLSAANLLSCIIPTENFIDKVSSAVLRFNVWDCRVVLYPDVGARMYSLCLQLNSFYVDEVAFAAQLLGVIKPVLSEVVHLTLEYQEVDTTTGITRRHSTSQPDRTPTDWRKVFGAFGNVKTLYMHNDLIGGVSRSLLLDGEESSVDLLPELNKLECYGGDDAGDAFAPFIDARKNAGRSLILVSVEHFPCRNNTIRPRIPGPFYRNGLPIYNRAI